MATAARTEGRGFVAGGPVPEPTTRVKVSDGDELDVWVVGEGTPVVLIHGAMTRDLLTPLVNELATTRQYRIVHYGRRGHGGRGLPAEAADIPGQAADVIEVLNALGIDRAHVAGHSLGAMIAIELATRAPHRLLSVISMDHLFLAQVRSEASRTFLQESADFWPQLIESYMGGDKEGAAAAFWDMTSEIEGAREVFEPLLPDGSWKLSCDDLSTFLQCELEPLMSWAVDPIALGNVEVPMAWVTKSPNDVAIVMESGQLLQEWAPHTETLGIASTSHDFPALNAAETAAAMHAWIQSHGGES